MTTYRSRLRLEGLVLAACGVIDAVAVLVLAPGATSSPLSTLVQLIVVAVVMASAGGLSVRRAIEGAVELPDDAGADGQPTALWKLPLVVAVLTLGFGPLAGWDAGLRVAGGCVIVGVAQALYFERLVAIQERRRGRRYLRIPGSRILGTKLGSLTDRKTA